MFVLVDDIQPVHVPNVVRYFKMHWPRCGICILDQEGKFLNEKGHFLQPQEGEKPLLFTTLGWARKRCDRLNGSQTRRLSNSASGKTRMAFWVDSRPENQSLEERLLRVIMQTTNSTHHSDCSVNP